MRAIVVTAGLCVLTAGCATGADVPDLTPSNTELASQTLASGECGLFGWARDTGRFILFSTESEAQYLSHDGTLNLIPVGDFPAENYGPNIALELGDGEVLDGGQRYAGARLVHRQQDGYELIQPIVAITSCAE